MARPIANSPKTGYGTSILSNPSCEKRGGVVNSSVELHGTPEMDRPDNFRVTRQVTDSSALDRSASEWLIDPRGCASDLLSSASAFAAVIGTVAVGRTVNPGHYSHSLPQPPIAPVAVAPLSLSGIFSNHLTYPKTN